MNASMNGRCKRQALTCLCGALVGLEGFAAAQAGWTVGALSGPGDEATSVFAADVDGDGDLDTLSASTGDDTIAWHENVLGDASLWGSRVISTSVLRPEGVFAADVDGDGDVDALSVGMFEYQSSIHWHENLDGDGSSWNTRLISVTGPVVVGVHAADMDGDGDIDALSAADLGDEIAWYENLNGDGSSWARRVISLSTNAAQAVSAADVDGDGDADVLSASASLHWHENLLGDGSSWEVHDIDTAGDFANSVAAGDLDGDGDLDVVAALLAADRVSWYENLTPGGLTWSRHDIDLGVDGPHGVHVSDMDGDGSLDVLGASIHDDSVALYGNPAGQGSSWSKVLLTTSAMKPGRSSPRTWTGTAMPTPCPPPPGTTRSPGTGTSMGAGRAGTRRWWPRSPKTRGRSRPRTSTGTATSTCSRG